MSKATAMTGRDRRKEQERVVEKARERRESGELAREVEEARRRAEQTRKEAERKAAQERQRQEEERRRKEEEEERQRQEQEERERQQREQEQAEQRRKAAEAYQDEQNALREAQQNKQTDVAPTGAATGGTLGALYDTLGVGGEKVRGSVPLSPMQQANGGGFSPFAGAAANIRQFTPQKAEEPASPKTGERKVPRPGEADLTDTGTGGNAPQKPEVVPISGTNADRAAIARQFAEEYQAEQDALRAAQAGSEAQLNKADAEQDNFAEEARRYALQRDADKAAKRLADLEAEDKTWWEAINWSEYQSAQAEAAKANKALEEFNGFAPAIKNWEGRDALIAELNDIDTNSGLISDPDEARAAAERRAEIISQLEAGDEAAGNGLQSYNAADRARQILGGSTAQYASGMANALGTGVAGLAELGDILGGDTRAEAGYATDPLSAESIGYQHDENSFADARRFAETVEAAADNWSESAAKDLESAKAGLTGLGAAGVDIATNVIQMGYDAALGGLGAMFVRSAGSAAQEARQDGASIGEQIAYGITKGGIEVATEKLFDGVAGVFGKGAADDVVEGLVKRLADTDTGRSVLRFIINSQGEGVEEVVSDLLGPFADRIYKDDALKNLFEDGYNGSELLYDYLIGIAVGSLGSGVAIATGQNAAKNAELRNEETIAPDEALAQAATPAAPIKQAPGMEVRPETDTGTGGPMPSNPLADTVIEAQQQVQQILSGPVSNANAEAIVTDPELKQEFEALTGIELKGTKSEQRAQVKAAAAENRAEAQAPQATEATPAEQVAEMLANPQTEQGAAPAEARAEEQAPPAPAVESAPAAEEAREGMEVPPAGQEASTEAPAALNTEAQTEAAEAPAKADMVEALVQAGVPTAEAEAAVEALVSQGTPQATANETTGIPGAERITEPAGENKGTDWQQAQPEAQSAPAAEPAGEEAGTDMTPAPAEAGTEQGGTGTPTGNAQDNTPIPKGAKISQYWSNTLKTIEDAANAPDTVKNPLWYMPKSEAQSLAEAASRLKEDTQGTVEKLVDAEAWSGTQHDAAAMVADQLYKQGQESGDWNGYRAWRKVMQNHVTETARGLQSVAKYTRHDGQGAVDSAVNTMADSDIPVPQQNEVISEVAKFADELDSIKEGDTDSLRDLIKRIANKRGNWTIFKGNMDKFLNKQSEAWLREAAYRQLEAIPRDAMNRGTQNLGAKVASYRVLAMLSGLPTIGRNIVGNTTFGLADMFSATGPGRAIDALLGEITGQRTVVGSRAGVRKTFPEWFKNAWSSMQTNMLETALDISMDERARPYNMPENSTFIADSNPIEKMFQRWSQIVSYALTSTDRFYRGGIETAGVENYNAFDKQAVAKGWQAGGTGLSADEKTQLAQASADYRLFQNKNGLSSIAQNLRRGMNNLIGIGGEVDAEGNRTKDNTFGLGSMLMPFIDVPTNIALKAGEYSPANIAKGIYEITQLAKAAHENSLASKENKTSTALLQQKAAMDTARGMTGTALLVAFTAIAKAGLIRNGDDEKDYDVSAVNQSTGQSGTQWNIDATLRALRGESTEWRPEDKLVGMGGISPLDLWMNAGTKFAAIDDPNAQNLTEAYLQGVISSTLDIPMFSTLADFQNTMRNAESFTLETGLDLAGDLLDNQMSGFVPQFIRQAAKAADPYYRDISADSWWQERANNAMQYIPGLRTKLPEKIDSFGQPKEQPGTPLQQWVNSELSPNSVSTYSPSEVAQALAGLKDESGKDSFYPDRKPPSSVSIPGENGGESEAYQLNAGQKRAYQQTYGQTYTDTVGSLLASAGWEGMSADAKVKAVQDAESYAKDAARRELAESLGREYSSDWDDERELPQDQIGDFFGAKEALKEAIKAEDYTALDALLETLGDHDEAVTNKLYDDVTRLKDREAAYKAGVDSETWAEAYEKYKELNNNGEMTKTQATIEFAKYLETVGGLSDEQKDLLRGQFGFYSVQRAKADTYDKLTGAGLSSEKADGLYTAISALQPDADHKGVTQNQKILAIGDYDMTEEEKWAALKIYASDACYKKAMEAKAAGKSYSEWANSYTSK